MQETWLPVVGYEGLYEVSEYGKVRSLDRIATDKRGIESNRKGRVLKAGINLEATPYPIYVLSKNGKTKTVKAHILVSRAFIGEPVDRQQVRHIDGNGLNNHYLNLAYGTAKENIHDIRVHGHNVNLNKTHCRFGHPYDEENTLLYLRPSGYQTRDCRKCAHRRQQEFRERRRQSKIVKG